MESLQIELTTIELTYSTLLVMIGNQQIGEVCGLCTDPDKNFFCGHCEAGLECFDSTPNEKDDPMICREIRGNIV